MNPELMATKIGSTKSESIGTALLSQFADLDARGMSAETARKLLELGFDDSQRQRVDVLSEKANKGALTPDEQDELDEYIRVGNLLAILQSKARLALKRVGL